MLSNTILHEINFQFEVFPTKLNYKSDYGKIVSDIEKMKELNSSFKDVTKSPLSKNDRQDFVSLDFFDFDSSYVVNAVLTPYKRDSIFDMKTNTDRMHTYNKFGKATGKLVGGNLTLVNDHPVLGGLTYSTSTSSLVNNISNTLQSNSTLVYKFSDNMPMLAVQEVGPSRRVGINLWDALNAYTTDG